MHMSDEQPQQENAATPPAGLDAARRALLLGAAAGGVVLTIRPALADGSLGGWLPVLIVGLPLIVAGSAGFIGPLLGGAVRKGDSNHA